MELTYGADIAGHISGSAGWLKSPYPDLARARLRKWLGLLYRQLGNAGVQAVRSISHREHGVSKLMPLAPGGVLLSQMFAGYLLLWWIGGAPHSPTPLTVARYAYYFGDLPEIRCAVVICSVLGIGRMGVGRAGCAVAEATSAAPAMLASPEDRNALAQLCSATRESCSVRPTGAASFYLDNRELRWLRRQDQAKVPAS